MKHLKKILIKRLIFLLLSSALVLCACIRDDDVGALEPQVSCENTVIDATFFTAGNSEVPNANWGGEQGVFTLITSVIGLSIDTTTGRLNWSKNLPIGTHIIEISASNSAGETTTNLTINNPFQGVFIGTYDTSFFF
jgi:hypothetical protein